MRCATVHNLIQEYLEGRLPKLDRNEFVHHVSECEACENEVLIYRELFGSLGRLPHFDVPRVVVPSVIAELRSVGVIRPQKVSVARKLLGRFLALPAPAKYPLAASIVVAALYSPIAALLGLMGGSVTSVTDKIADLYVSIETAMNGVSVLGRVLDTVSDYLRAFAVLLRASASVVSSANENLYYGGMGILAVISCVLLLSLIAKRRKASRHATHSIF